MKTKIISVAFILAALLSASSSLAASAKPEDASSGSSSAQPTVVVFRFRPRPLWIVGGAPVSSAACEDYSRTGEPIGEEPKIDANVLDAISTELQKKLSLRNVAVLIDPDPNTIPAGSLIITGCIFRADKGITPGRMVGMGLGASRLGAHVVVVSKTQTGFTQLDAFDVQVKARSIVPPPPPTVTDISPLGSKLADEVATKFNKSLKRRLAQSDTSRGN
jgi:hypothetical protein